ncbi:hypothetical protein BJ508DRAFT_336945, partial [Ascobolus immersus RN42]
METEMRELRRMIAAQSRPTGAVASTPTGSSKKKRSVSEQMPVTPRPTTSKKRSMSEQMPATPMRETRAPEDDDEENSDNSDVTGTHTAKRHRQSERLVSSISSTSNSSKRVKQSSRQVPVPATPTPAGHRKAARSSAAKVKRNAVCSRRKLAADLGLSTAGHKALSPIKSKMRALGKTIKPNFQFDQNISWHRKHNQDFDGQINWLYKNLKPSFPKLQRHHVISLVQQCCEDTRRDIALLVRWEDETGGTKTDLEKIKRKNPNVSVDKLIKMVISGDISLPSEGCSDDEDDLIDDEEGPNSECESTYAGDGDEEDEMEGQGDDEMEGQGDDEMDTDKEEDTADVVLPSSSMSLKHKKRPSDGEATELPVEPVPKRPRHSSLHSISTDTTKKQTAGGEEMSDQTQGHTKSNDHTGYNHLPLHDDDHGFTPPPPRHRQQEGNNAPHSTQPLPVETDGSKNMMMCKGHSDDKVDYVTVSKFPKELTVRFFDKYNNLLGFGNWPVQCFESFEMLLHYHRDCGIIEFDDSINKLEYRCITGSIGAQWPGSWAPLVSEDDFIGLIKIMTTAWTDSRWDQEGGVHCDLDLHVRVSDKEQVEAEVDDFSQFDHFVDSQSLADVIGPSQVQRNGLFDESQTMTQYIEMDKCDDRSQDSQKHHDHADTEESITPKETGKDDAVDTAIPENISSSNSVLETHAPSKLVSCEDSDGPRVEEPLGIPDAPDPHPQEHVETQ